MRSERAGIISEGRIRGVLDLIAEAVSPSNPDHDLTIKRGTYARAGVPEYWIVLPEQRGVLVLSAPIAAHGTYGESRRITSGMELVSPTLPVRLPVDALFQYLASPGQ